MHMPRETSTDRGFRQSMLEDFARALAHLAGIRHAQDYKDCLGEQSQDGLLSDLRKFFAISAVKVFNRRVRRVSAEGAEKISPELGMQDCKDCFGEQSQDGFLSDLRKFFAISCGKSL